MGDETVCTFASCCAAFPGRFFLLFGHHILLVLWDGGVHGCEEACVCVVCVCICIFGRAARRGEKCRFNMSVWGMGRRKEEKRGEG